MSESVPVAVYEVYQALSGFAIGRRLSERRYGVLAVGKDDGLREPAGELVGELNSQ